MKVGRPDVEVEAVLAHGRGRNGARGMLHAGRAEVGRVANAFPRGGRLRSMPAERASGRGGVGDSFKDVRAHGGDGAGEFSLGDADVRRGRLRGESCGSEEEQQAEKQEFSHGWFVRSFHGKPKGMSQAAEDSSLRG